MLHLEQIPTLHQDFVKNLRRALSRPETFAPRSILLKITFQQAFNYSKLTMEKLEQGVKYAQSQQ